MIGELIKKLKGRLADFIATGPITNVAAIIVKYCGQGFLWLGIAEIYVDQWEHATIPILTALGLKVAAWFFKKLPV